MIVYVYTYAHVDDFMSHAHNVLVYVYTTSTQAKIEEGLRSNHMCSRGRVRGIEIIKVQVFVYV